MGKPTGKKKSILVIGMGRFGKHMAMNLQKYGNDVMVVDKEEKIVQNVSESIDDAIVGDCTDQTVLKTLGISNFDICFVTIGKNLEASLVITSYLKKLGAKYIITKAGRDLHAGLLRQIGADEVVYPERELAEKLAFKYSTGNIFDFFEITDDYSVYEMEVPSDWVGKSIGKIGIRTKHKINVIAVKNDTSFVPTPDADFIFSSGDVIIVIGKQHDMEKMHMS